MIPIFSSTRTSINDLVPCKTFKKAQENRISLIRKLEKGIFLSDQNDPNKKWELKNVKDSKSTEESGATPQLKVLVEKNNVKIYGRLKLINTMNEAIIYQKMQLSKDPLNDYIPKYLGVLDSRGNVIDLKKELEQIGEEAVIQKYKPAYIILGDILKEFDSNVKVDGEVQDYKFARSSLLGNDEEVRRHKQNYHGTFYKVFRKKFLALSGCAFAHQGSTKGGWFMWFVNGIRRVFSVSNTKNELQKQFNRMGIAELAHNMRSLIKFKRAIQNSNFTSADSSLLFVPVSVMRNGRVRKDIEIRLIDLSHGVNKEENISGFDQMRADMATSIQELIDMIRQAYLGKSAFRSGRQVEIDA